MIPVIKQSKEINLNYAAKICRVDAIEPIAGADKIVNAVLGNDKAIVSKDMKVGDIVVFFPCESVIHKDYIQFHNLYDDYNLNSNKEEYKELRDKIAVLQASPNKDLETLQSMKDELRKMKGFFNKTGRVRMLKLRGEYSLGYVTSVRTLEAVWPDLKKVIWSRHLGEQFDMIGDERICWKYVPKTNRSHRERKEYPMPWYKRSMRRLKKFDRLVPGQFAFHYDTGKLVDNIQQFSPFDACDITVKVHGTSVIISNLLTNKKLTRWEKIKRFLGCHVQEQVYDNIYSSRRVIKNRYINPYKHNDYYDTDIHGCVARDFSQFLDKGMTVYGEIVGYCEGSDKFIQKDHDYGCEPGHWKFMPYRITMTTEYGVVKEWELQDVINWTDTLIETCKQDHPELTDKILPLVRIYHGRIGDMYDNLYAKVAEGLTMDDYEKEKEDWIQSEAYDGTIPRRLETPEQWVIDKWRTAWLDAMKHDTKLIGMEKREPLCKNKVPREGIVIRKIHDPRAEAFKLKSAAHFHLEMMQHDAGESDMEEES